MLLLFFMATEKGGLVQLGNQHLERIYFTDFATTRGIYSIFLFKSEENKCKKGMKFLIIVEEYFYLQLHKSEVCCSLEPMQHQ